MTGSTGIPTGLQATAGVDYSIPLPYDVPDIGTNRVGYYFAASTIGDAYRKAVKGSAADYAWIAAAATIDDTHFAAAFPPQAGLEQRRAWFRAAYAALEAPGGTSAADLLVTVTPEGAATISSKSQSTATTTMASGPPPALDKEVAASIVAGQVVGPTGLAPTSSASGTRLPSWIWWVAGIVGVLFLLKLLKRS